MSQRLRLALVGCGAISEWHRRALAKVPEIEITACVDPDRARAEAAAAGTDDIGDFMRTILERARNSLDRTPRLLAVLTQFVVKDFEWQAGTINSGQEL
jgi:hypothetical protein